MTIKLIPKEGCANRSKLSVGPLLSANRHEHSDQLPLAVNSVIVDAGCESVIEPHESIEMWVVVRGEGIVCSDGTDYAAKAGDVFYFESLVEHKVKNHSDRSMLITSVWCKT